MLQVFLYVSNRYVSYVLRLCGNLGDRQVCVAARVYGNRRSTGGSSYRYSSHRSLAYFYFPCPLFFMLYAEDNISQRAIGLFAY